MVTTLPAALGFLLCIQIHICKILQIPRGRLQDCKRYTNNWDHLAGTAQVVLPLFSLREWSTSIPWKSHMPRVLWKSFCSFRSGWEQIWIVFCMTFTALSPLGYTIYVTFMFSFENCRIGITWSGQEWQIRCLTKLSKLFHYTFGIFLFVLGRHVLDDPGT